MPNVETYFYIQFENEKIGLLSDLTFIWPCIVIYFYSKANKMRQCIKFILFWNDTTCFGRAFRPSSGVQDCTYINKHM